MDTPAVTFIAFLVVIFITFAVMHAATILGRRAHVSQLPTAGPTGPPKPTQACPVAGVHTYQLNSIEETAGAHIHIYRCQACGDVERWIAHS